MLDREKQKINTPLKNTSTLKLSLESFTLMLLECRLLFKIAIERQKLNGGLSPKVEMLGYQYFYTAQQRKKIHEQLGRAH